MTENCTFKMINEKTAAELLGVSTQTIRNWRNKNHGPAFLRIGSLIRYRVMDIELFIENSRVSTKDSK